MNLATRTALIENATRCAAEMVDADTKAGDIAAMVDGYLPADIMDMVRAEGGNEIHASMTEATALYGATCIKEAKRLRKVAKSKPMIVDGHHVTFDSNGGAHVHAASGTLLGWCNAEGLYMSLASPERETLVVRIAHKALNLPCE